MKNKSILVSFIAGVALTAILFFSIKSCFSTGKKEEKSDFYLLNNQISRMNKMVVMEQDFSTLQKTSVKYEILGQKVSNNNIMAYTTTKAQVSYDLNKMKMEVDSVNKKLIIRELPDAEIKIIPSVEIQSIDDSFFNRVTDEDIKNVTKKAKDNAINKVDQNHLRSEGRKQLIENLNSIFVLAKALNYTIEDETGKLNLKL